jgi:hypothetical protein
MSCALAIAPQETTANLFQLCDLYGKIKVAYCPSASGPIIEGHAAGASLKYQGPEGNWTFHGSEISHEETSLGQLISVVLRPEGGSAPVTFAVFLPPVVLAGSDSESFTTFGVKDGSHVQRPNKQISYEVERFFGEAKALVLPL